jgi:hypothetical protein
MEFQFAKSWLCSNLSSDLLGTCGDLTNCLFHQNVNVAEATIMKQEEHDVFYLQPQSWTKTINRVIPGTLLTCYRNSGYNYLATRQEGGIDKTIMDCLYSVRLSSCLWVMTWVRMNFMLLLEYSYENKALYLKNGGNKKSTHHFVHNMFIKEATRHKSYKNSMY